ncbi:MAG: hypothetical protein WBG90_14620 [Saonia sp.]
MKNRILHTVFFIVLFTIFFILNRNYILNSYQAEPLRVSFEIVTAEEDVFQLFYREPTGKFNESLSKRTKVLGSRKAQWLNYDIPDTLNVSHFRFDFGNNNHTSPVLINQVILSFNGNNKTINRDKLEDYFKPNKYAEASNSGYIRKVIGIRSDPFFYSVDLVDIIKGLKAKPDHGRIIINTILSFFLALSFSFAILFKNTKKEIQTSFYRAFIFCFFLLMIIPHLDEIFDKDNTIITEKRELTKKPKLDMQNIEAYPKEFESYYNDNFGFRKKMISLSSIIKVKLLKTSPKSDRVIVGKDNWLFYWEEDIQNSYLNKRPFKDSNLGNFGTKLKEINEWSSDRGKTFLVTIYPNKHTIYGDKVPRRFKLLKKEGKRRVDQTYIFLKKNNINNIEQEKVISKNKGNHPLYLKNDSHWNSLGAYYAYKNIIEKLSLSNNNISKPLKIEDFELEFNRDYRKGDLLNLLGVDNRKGYFKDTYIKFKHSIKRNLRQRENVYGNRSVVIDNPNAINNKTAMFFGDSYSYELFQFLPIHFNKTIFVRSIKLNDKLIEEINPDIIVYGIVERNLENL